ncbi:ER membrane protein complex subunit 2-B [Porphyridium purpureum]|uniref:ER membrane protein complex subunit 2 n=1 Tax=Porphyridium purpureum TaxID=35688 RepID=A0A5J4YYG3_PORPP|nr:ER membrane protein complex subunit 2-B [Porphyridium purpureum]|eukprot:POR1475..scf209_3
MSPVHLEMQASPASGWQCDGVMHTYETVLIHSRILVHFNDRRCGGHPDARLRAAFFVSCPTTHGLVHLLSRVSPETPVRVRARDPIEFEELCGGSLSRSPSSRLGDNEKGRDHMSVQSGLDVQAGIAARSHESRSGAGDALVLKELESVLKLDRMHPAFVWQWGTETGATHGSALRDLGRWERVIAEAKLSLNGYEMLFSLGVSALHARAWALFDAVERRLKQFLGPSEKIPRLKLLQGMKAEAERRWEDAQEQYLKILSTDGDPPSSARLVAMLRSQLRDQEALLTLQRYVADVPTDKAAWQELRKLSCELHDYERAAFAACQCILLMPSCAYTAQRAAEVYYSMEAYGTARNYYARSIHISLASASGGAHLGVKSGPSNRAATVSLHSVPVSAVWGLWVTCIAIAAEQSASNTQPAGSGVDAAAADAGMDAAQSNDFQKPGMENNSELLRWSQRLLLAIYRDTVSTIEGVSTMSVQCARDVLVEFEP